MSLCSLMHLLDLGLGNLLVQAYVTSAVDRQQLSTLCTTAYLTLAAIGLPGALILIALAWALPGPFKIPPEHLREASRVFTLIAISTTVSFATTALDLLYQAFHRFDRLNQVQLLMAGTRVVLTVFFLANGYGIVALAAIHAVLSVLRAVLLKLALPSSIPGAHLQLSNFRWPVLRPLLTLSRWSVLDNVVRQIASVSDAFILGVFGSVSSVAIFGVGNKLPAQLSNLVSTGAVVILPSLAQHHADRDSTELRRIFVNVQRLVFTGVLPVVVLGCICARPLIELWAGRAYLEAAVVMQWLLLAALSLALEYSADLLLYACGEVKTASLLAATAGVANVAVSLVIGLSLRCGWSGRGDCFDSRSDQRFLVHPNGVQDSRDPRS